ncbi:hypothetical protein BD309DRAFT_992308 [Dichomitus squalens]|nr:hypothetical protein BD309DRAFT_992308 [Dichomitus squalens]
MTEYATDPEAIHDFLTARERTVNWVNVHGAGLNFASPSSPPSVLSEEGVLSYGPSESDASSSHSVPPRMLLRYEDGRPDIPISHSHSPHSRGGPSAQSSSRHTRSRSGSLAPPAPADMPPMPARHAQSLSYASGSRYASAGPSGQPLISPSRSPEDIRILPSRQPDDSQRMAAASTQMHAFPQQPSIHDRVPPLADQLHTSNQSVYAPTARHATSPNQPIPIAASPATVTQMHSQPAGHHNGGSRFYEKPGMAASRVQSGLPYQYSPPAIVYAPSGRHGGRSNYQPPAIVYSPSSHGHHRAPAPGIAYSRSDPFPLPTQYSPQARAGATPFPPSQGSSSHRSRQRAQSTTEHLSSRGRSRGPSSSRDHPRTRSPTPSLSASETSSDTSGSTYYVLPSPGQKVQIIVPNAATVYTSTPKSSPRSPRSPSSANDSPKKAFFARIFSRGSGSVDSRGSSGQARGERGRIPFSWR